MTRVLPTTITFPEGATEGVGRVSLMRADGPQTILVVDATPFHPVDHTWPDQPGDRGVVEVGGVRVPVAEAVMAAVSDDGVFAVGADIPVKRGTEGWTWLVGHRIADAAPDALAEGASVHLRVDAAYRAGLSRGHTACHLASLALDLAVADLWRKDAGSDALGNPDFEGRANRSSRIREDGAVDEYRLGKSLRKAGFDSEALRSTLPEREERINAQLAAWIASDAPSRIIAEGATIIDRRRWRCELPEGVAEILCGGTHVSSLAELGCVRVSLDASDPQLLVMTTAVIAD